MFIHGKVLFVMQISFLFFFFWGKWPYFHTLDQSVHCWVPSIMLQKTALDVLVRTQCNSPVCSFYMCRPTQQIHIGASKQGLAYAEDKLSEQFTLPDELHSKHTTDNAFLISEWPYVSLLQLLGVCVQQLNISPNFIISWEVINPNPQFISVTRASLRCKGLWPSPWQWLFRRSSNLQKRLICDPLTPGQMWVQTLQVHPTPQKKELFIALDSVLLTNWVIPRKGLKIELNELWAFSHNLDIIAQYRPNNFRPKKKQTSFGRVSCIFWVDTVS